MVEQQDNSASDDDPDLADEMAADAPDADETAAAKKAAAEIGAAESSAAEAADEFSSAESAAAETVAADTVAADVAGTEIGAAASDAAQTAAADAVAAEIAGLGIGEAANAAAELAAANAAAAEHVAPEIGEAAMQAAPTSAAGAADTVSLADLGKLLRDRCGPVVASDGTLNAGRIEKALKLARAGKLANLRWWDDGEQVGEEQVRKRLEQLESCQLTADHALEDVSPLAVAYGLSPLMLEHLRSEPVEGAVKGCFNENDMTSSSVPGPHLDKPCEYWTPRKRLLHSPTEFARLVIHKKTETGRPGFSDTHTHRGDELILLLQGKMEVYLESNGARIRLSKGDYIHFHAEHEHSAWGVEHATEDAIGFVIRFHQLPAGGDRPQIQSILQRLSLQLVGAAAAESTTAESPDQFDKWVAGWLRQAFRSPVSRESLRTPTDVLDMVGLSDFLSSLQNQNGLSAKEVWEKARKLARLKEGEFDHLLEGRYFGRLDTSDLHGLSQGYDVPRVLLSSFLFPTYPNMVAVENSRDAIESDIEGELPDLGDLYELSKVEGEHYEARYFLPRRRLAGSDVQVTYIELPPSGETPPNKHPGSELVLPLEGCVRVTFPGSERGDLLLDSADQAYGHYDSTLEHQVLNDGDSTAQVFVVRFQRPFGEE